MRTLGKAKRINQCVSNSTTLKSVLLGSMLNTSARQIHARMRSVQKLRALCINYSVATSLGVINTTNSRRSSLCRHGGKELTNENIPNSSTLSLPDLFFAKKYRPQRQRLTAHLCLRFNFLFIYRFAALHAVSLL